MARTGRFGRLPAEAQDLSATIASMISQYENQRDRNVEFAWNHGGKFEGQKVTDQFFLGWWQKRRNEVSDDDPMADYYDQMIFNYRFQIREQKVTLAYTQGKIKELGVARFYVEEAGKVPRNSAIWRDLMTNAARFRKAAAKGRNSGAKQTAFERFQNQWNNLEDTYIKPAGTVEDIVNSILTATDTGSRNQWTQAMGGGEMSMVEELFAKIESDPAYERQWKDVWEPALRKADPHHFRGNLSADYLAGVYGRAKQGAKKQSKLADRRGYTDWKRSADKSAGQWGGRQATQARWDLATDVEEVWRDALDAGLEDMSKTPAERMEIRAAALAKLGGLRRKAESMGADTLQGNITRDMRVLRGDKGAENRGGSDRAISADVGDIPDSEGDQPSAQEGGKFGSDIASQARQDQEDHEALITGTSVIVEETDANGVTTKSVVPRGQVRTGLGVAVEIVKAHGSSYRSPDGKPTESGSGPITIVRYGQPIRVQVAAQESVTGMPVPTGAGADALTTSGVVGYRYQRGDGSYQYQLFRDDGTVVWTDAPTGGNGSDLFRQGVVMGTATSSNGELIITVRDDTTAGGTLEQVGVDPDTGQPIYNERPRNALTDEVRYGKAEADRRERGTPDQQDTRARTEDARSLVATITGLDTSKWSADERAAFAALSPENKRYLIDQGIVTGGDTQQKGGGGFSRIKPEEMTNERINDAKAHGNAPARWFGGASGTQPVDAPIPPIPDDLGDLGVSESQWRGMVKDMRAGKSSRQVLDTYLKPEQRRRADQPGQVALGRLRNHLNEEGKATRQEPTQPRDGTEFVDPQARIGTLKSEIAGLEDQLKKGTDPSGNALPQGRIDEMRASVQTMKQEIIKTGLSSRTGRQQVVAEAVSTAAGVGDFLGRLLGRNGLTDGTNPVTVEQPDTFTEYQTLVGSKDQANRAAMSQLSDIEIINGLMLSDPQRFSGQDGRKRIDAFMSEVAVIRANASKDNSTYTADRLTDEGVPGVVADTVAGNHPGGKAGRKGGQRNQIDAMQDSIYAQDESLIRDPAFIFEDDDGDTPVGPFIWGGGKGDPTQWGGLAQFSITNRRDGAAGATDGESDRPTMKLPTLFGLTGFGAITAQQAERERLRAEATATIGSSVTFDPRTRKPVNVRGSRVTPEPNVKTPKPPEPPEEVKPPPGSKEAIDRTRREWQNTPTKIKGLSKYDLIESRDDRPY